MFPFAKFIALNSILRFKNRYEIYLDEITSVLIPDDTTLISSATDIQAALIKLKSETKKLIVLYEITILTKNPPESLTLETYT